MAGLLSRARDLDWAQEDARANSIDWWVQNMLQPANEQLIFGGSAYSGFRTTFGVGRQDREISWTLPNYLASLRRCPPAFAAELVRSSVLSQARFVWRRKRGQDDAGRVWTDDNLAMFEKPWTNATTSDLIARMEWHAGLAGNSFVVRQGKMFSRPTRLRVLRPDWVAILYGSQLEPKSPYHALDGEVVGYAYANGGFEQPSSVQVLEPFEVAHWAPIPDPEAPGLGMSWITPAVRDIQGDIGFTEHKLAYLRNGATPNIVVKGLPFKSLVEFNKLVDDLEKRHAGIANAYKTLYLTVGADASIVGSDLTEMDYKNVQGGGETRIAMLSRVPAAILQISEGLAGSALNAGNFNAARRVFVDTWVYSSLTDLTGTLEPLAIPQTGSELAVDMTGMPILREDAKDAAEISQIEAATIGQLIKDGYVPDSAVAAVVSRDMSKLIKQHTGLVSVQLQPPGTQFQPTPVPPPLPVGANKPKPPALPAANGAGG